MKEINFSGRLISKTDTTGRIIEVNDNFVEVSGYSREELVGAPHNIVRHPDMPKKAFEWMWATLKAGRPWRGIVKNRTKNGDFYWVDAFVVPLREQGEVRGYMSVRSVPSRESILAAELLYRSGSLPPRRLTVSIRTKLIALAASGLMGATLLAGAGYMDGRRSDAQMDSMQKVHDILDQASVMRFWLKEQEGQVFKALQHNPRYDVSLLHDHPLDRHTNAIKVAGERVEEVKTEISKMSLPDNIAPLVQKTIEQSQEVEKVIAAINAEYSRGDYEKAAIIMTKQLVPAYNRFDASTLAMIDEIRQTAMLVAENGRVEREANTYILFATLAVTLLMLLTVSSMIYLSMTRRIHEAEREMDRIASGDISSRPGIGQDDEVGRMIESVATTAVSLNVLVEEVRRHASSIAERGHDLSKSMHSISAASQNQLNKVVEVSGSINQVSTSVQEVAQNAGAAAENTVQTHRAVEASIAQLSESIHASERVIQSVKGAEQTIGGLLSSIHAIGEASKSIREIADQTNLLALNAAIEAARAGEQGRGFAVVADEVRKLAEKTASATSEIESVVRRIAGEAEAASRAMNTTVEDVGNGIGRMKSSGKSIEGITALTERVTEMTQGIAAAANEQGQASEQVSLATTDISHLIEKTNESVGAASQSAKELTKAADLLISSVSRFKT